MRKKTVFTIIVVVVGIIWVLSLDFSTKSKEFRYGVSFSKFHANELKLDWKQTYLALLNDLGVKHFRFSAHWPTTEPQEGKYNFSELDFQMREAENHHAFVIMAIGRRLPGWPECHAPDWALKLPLDQQRDRILKLMEQVVNRYKKSPAIEYWQVENEPFLGFFGRSTCGASDIGINDFVKKEIDLVHRLDPSRKILVTDSGEFGTWYKAYNAGDVFGTSMYLYVWWRNFIGPLRYPIIPAFFRIKHNLITLIFGQKPSIVIELSAEPWLLQPLVDAPVETQINRMGIDKFNEMIDFSSKTGFDTFYLWGSEWWYWMKFHGHPEFWNRAKELFAHSNNY